MKRIKVLTLGLMLGVAGAVYAAQGGAQVATPDNAAASCSSMAECCTGGSCKMNGDCCSCCTDGTCRMGGSCCSTHKQGK